MLGGPWDKEGPGNWSQSLPLSDLQGLDAGQFAGPQTTPARFELVRPAGRLTCNGSVGSAAGGGSCVFAPDEGFATMLAGRGFPRPSLRQSYALAMSGFRPDVLDALTEAGYRQPGLDELVPLGIFQIRPDYVQSMAKAGYRLGSVGHLVAFKIHRVTPEMIAAYRELGYGELRPHTLISMAIHRVTPDYIDSFARAGFRNLPPDKLVRMRIFGITPEFLESVEVDEKTSRTAKGPSRRTAPGSR